MQEYLAALWQRQAYIFSAALTGGAVFVAVQKLAGARADIALAMGRGIVNMGGYDAHPLVVGWSVHLAISLAYCVLFALLLLLLPPVRALRLGAGLGIALALGWLTTLLTVPAITVTISMLAGKGWPAHPGALNTGLGLPLWNHLGFFAIAWLFIALLAELRSARAAGENEAE